MKNIEFYKKEVYGNPLFYIKDSVMAAHFRKLTGKKTITKYEMHELTALTGVTFTQVMN